MDGVVGRCDVDALDATIALRDGWVGVRWRCRHL